MIWFFGDPLHPLMVKDHTFALFNFWTLPLGVWSVPPILHCYRLFSDGKQIVFHFVDLNCRLSS